MAEQLRAKGGQTAVAATRYWAREGDREAEARFLAWNAIWRNDADGRAILLHITDAGLTAIGIEPEGPKDSPAEVAPAPKARTPRTGTKQAKLIEMLRGEGGATIDEIATATSRQPHTVRGTMSGTLKKKLGLTINSEKVEGRGRIYKLAAT